MLNTLEEMERILRSHDRHELGDLLARIAAEDNSDIFQQEVTSLRVWGGKGSIVDATLKEPSDERRFNELIVDLAEALDQLGIGTFRSRWVGRIIEDWLISHPK
jgi:hypothetical protein